MGADANVNAEGTGAGGTPNSMRWVGRIGIRQQVLLPPKRRRSPPRRPLILDFQQGG